MNILKLAFMVSAFFILDPVALAQLDRSTWGEKYATSGSQLLLKETGREHNESGNTVVKYRLTANGLQRNRIYNLWVWQIGREPEVALQGVTLDSQGKAVCAGKPDTCVGDGPDDPINLKVVASLGEPKRFALISTDNKQRSFVSVIPFPIESTFGACSISAEKYQPEGASFLIKGRGFPPHQEVTVQTRSGKENRPSTEKASEDGSWQFLLFPFVKNSRSGRTKIEIATGTCSVALSVDWGENSYKLE